MRSHYKETAKSGAAAACDECGWYTNDTFYGPSKLEAHKLAHKDAKPKIKQGVSTIQPRNRRAKKLAV